MGALSRHIAGGVAALALLAGCAQGTGGAGFLAGSGGFPPDRAAWTGAPPAAQAAHARAMHLLLNSLHRRNSTTWEGGGASGSIQVESYGPVGETFCAIVRERIAGPASSASVRDLACWGNGWTLARDNAPGIPVLGPAFRQQDKVHTARGGTTLAAIARRTGSNLAALRALNPGHPRRLKSGTPILLP